MKKNIKIIITKNNNQNDDAITQNDDTITQNDINNSELINSYIKNDDIYKKEEIVNYNLQYIIKYILSIINYLIKKYITLILLFLIILYFYIKYT